MTTEERIEALEQQVKALRKGLGELSIALVEYIGAGNPEFNEDIEEIRQIIKEGEEKIANRNTAQ